MYKEKESVEKALSQNGALLNNRHLHVTKSSYTERDFKTTIFVGNLPYAIDEEEVWELFSKYGDINYVRIIRDKITH